MRGHRTAAPRRRSAVLLAGVLIFLGLAGHAGAQDEVPDGAVVALEITGALTAVNADEVSEQIELAESSGAAAVLVRLDTPGGRLDLTRDIVQEMLLAEVPVVVHVAPTGARAGSAGTFITYAAHVAAMASGTTIGAATPVDIEGGEVSDKVLQDSISYAEALAEERGRSVEFIVDAVRDGRSERASVAHDLGAVDLIVDDTEALLAEIDGQQVTLDSGETVTLATADAPIVEAERSLARQVLGMIATPDIAFLLISVGTLGVIYELANPGLGIGGILGAVMLVLAFAALAVLPTNVAGVALLLLAMGLLVAELFVPGIGVLAGGGTVALLLAGLLLFEDASGLGVSWAVLAPTVLLAGAGALGIGVLAARMRRAPVRSGPETVIGRRVQVRRIGDEHVQVWMEGSLWEARVASGAEVAPGDWVQVTDRDGLYLTVEPEEETWSSTP